MIGKFTFHPDRSNEPVVARLEDDLSWSTDPPGWAGRLGERFPAGPFDGHPSSGHRGHRLIREAAQFFGVEPDLEPVPESDPDAVH